MGLQMDEFIVTEADNGNGMKSLPCLTLTKTLLTSCC